MALDFRRPEQNQTLNDDLGEERPNRVRDELDDARLLGERNELIRRYLTDRAKRRQVVTTTRTPRGQVIDWIPRESQVAAGKVAEPPDEDRIDLGQPGTSQQTAARFGRQAPALRAGG